MHFCNNCEKLIPAETALSRRGCGQKVEIPTLHQQVHFQPEVPQFYTKVSQSETFTSIYSFEVFPKHEDIRQNFNL